MKKFLLIALTIHFWINGSISVSQADDEQFFQQAYRYTVKIETRVEIPFDGGDKGSLSGAGFLVDDQRGWIITNAHVVSRSPSHVSVAFHDQDFHPAEKYYIDPYLDLAIIKVPTSSIPANIQAASLECNHTPHIGHPIGAFGHPWKFSFTGTRGIISGKTSRLGGELLQTDAPINSGNSGGPLISMKTGKVVGINTASLKRANDQNTNFAEPMKYSCRILHLLQEGRDPSPPDLTVIFQRDIDDRNKLIVAKTYLSKELVPLQEGDIIDKVEGTPDRIQNEGQFIHALRGRLNHVGLEVIRSGERKKITGKLKPALRITERQGIYFSGVLLSPLMYRDRSELNFPFRVNYVEPGSLGEIKKIEHWDRLMLVDGKHFETLQALYLYLKHGLETKKEVSVKLRDISKLDDRIYDYKNVSLEVQNLKFFGFPKTN